MNIITASFDTDVRQITEMYQRKKAVLSSKHLLYILTSVLWVVALATGRRKITSKWFPFQIYLASYSRTPGYPSQRTPDSTAH